MDGWTKSQATRIDLARVLGWHKNYKPQHTRSLGLASGPITWRVVLSGVIDIRYVLHHRSKKNAWKDAYEGMHNKSHTGEGFERVEQPRSVQNLFGTKIIKLIDHIMTKLCSISLQRSILRVTGSFTMTTLLDFGRNQKRYCDCRAKIWKLFKRIHFPPKIFYEQNCAHAYKSKVGQYGGRNGERAAAIRISCYPADVPW